MLKIGEFSKLSHITVKALRFYEREGLLLPAQTDDWNGYRYYETSQLDDAARIKAYRQLGLSIAEIQAILGGSDARQILAEKEAALVSEKEDIELRLSLLHHILEDKEMKYSVTVKEIPSAIVYSAETTLAKYMDLMEFIPAVGEECTKLNPGLSCTNPPYEFCEYLDNEHRDEDVRIRHSEAVDRFGRDSDRIYFREIPAARVLSIFHKGPYEQIGEAYAYIMQYAEENGYQTAGLARECYIDGIWNKETADEWLTEIQLPIE